MSIANPPCIDIFVGCSTTDYGGSGDGSSTSSRSSASASDYPSFGNRTDSSSGTTSSFSRSSSSSSSLSIYNGAADNISQRLSATAQRVAQYTIATTNRGTQAVKNYVFSHGSLPSEATFDPTRSSAGCMQVGQDVQCTMDLEPGETKTVDLSYNVNNAVSCAIARELQRVKTIGSGTSGVSTSVSCSMKTIDTNAVVASNSSSSESSVTEEPTNGSGAFVFVSSGSYVPPVAIDAIGLTTSGKGGYKGGYNHIPMPRTGAADILFQSAITSGVLTRYTPEAVSDFSGQTFIVSIVFGALLLAVFVRRSIQRA